MSPEPRLWRWAERWLRRFTDSETAEAILGDLAEGQPADGPHHPASSLRVMAETLSVTWLLLLDRWTVRRGQVKGDASVDAWSRSMRRAAAWIGLAACLPAALLVLGGMLQMFAGTPQVLQLLDRTIHNENLAFVRFLRHPATIFAGLLLAGAVNLLPLLRIRLSRDDGTMVGTVALRTRGPHLAVGVLSGVLLAVILGYGFTENFRIVQRSSEFGQLPSSTGARAIEARASSETALAPCSEEHLVYVLPSSTDRDPVASRPFSKDELLLRGVAVRVSTLQPDCEISPLP